MLIENQYVGKGLPSESSGDPNWQSYPWVCDNNDAVSALLAQCPAHHETPLTAALAVPNFPTDASLWLKDETARMGLGSFKALGAAFAIAQHADAARRHDELGWEDCLKGKTYVAASAGNHGLSIAAGARLFGATAVIILAENVPNAFKQRLENFGAKVLVHGCNYAQSMAKAQAIQQETGAILLSDSSWANYVELPWHVMQGYTQCATECVRQMGAGVPTKIFLQAGVGGLAAAAAAVFRKAWGQKPGIYVVEPAAAPALQQSILAGRCVFADGPVSNMGRLDCKEPSVLALKSLARDANAFLTINDEQADRVVELLQNATGIVSTPSGVAGLAGALSPGLAISADDIVLCIISEGATA